MLALLDLERRYISEHCGKPVVGFVSHPGLL